jgi:hypothetical protein
MRVLRTAAEREVLQSFAESEFSSPRHRDEAAAWIESYTARSRILTTRPTDWSPDDRAIAVEAIRRYRGVILDGLFAQKASWHAAELGPEELPALLTIDYPPFVALSDDRRLGKLVGAMDAGGSTAPDGFSSGYRNLKKTYQAGEVLGRPGLAAKSEAGPFVVFDGLTRLSVLRSRAVAGESVPQTISVFLALSPRLEKSTWKWL